MSSSSIEGEGGSTVFGALGATGLLDEVALVARDLIIAPADLDWENPRSPSTALAFLAAIRRIMLQIEVETVLST